jgi:hypothetical protein
MESSPGQGSVVSFSLPAKAVTAAPAGRGGTFAARHPLRILLVDDTTVR